MSPKVQYAIQVLLILGSLAAAYIVVNAADIEESYRSRVLLLGVTVGAIVAIVFNLAVDRKRRRDSRLEAVKDGNVLVPGLVAFTLIGVILCWLRAKFNITLTYRATEGRTENVDFTPKTCFIWAATGALIGATSRSIPSRRNRRRKKLLGSRTLMPG